MINMRRSVYAVAIILTLFPTLASFYAAQTLLESAVTMGLNPRILVELDRAGGHLKELAKLNSTEKEKYRSEFNQLQELRQSYEALLDSSSSLNRAYFQVFAILLAFALSSALALATWLNRRVIRSSDLTVRAMRKAQKRVLYLENRESWRLFAQKLVHEVKNPLTTVQVLMGRLPKKYQATHVSPSESFLSDLNETKVMVAEEVQKLNAWVEAFSRYARMPDPKLTKIHATSFLREFVEQNKEMWPHLHISVDYMRSPEVLLNIDPMLIKQVLFNLFKNSFEAGRGAQINLDVKARMTDGNFYSIVISDNGPGIPQELRSKLFHPYISGKSKEEGMGLGLAIAKKVMQDHGGDIALLNTESGTSFELTFNTLNASQDEPNVGDLNS